MNYPSRNAPHCSCPIDMTLTLITILGFIQVLLVNAVCGPVVAEV